MNENATIALNEELRFHRCLARPGTFVDVGAYIGDFTFGLADIEGLDLVAIEPLPRALDALSRRAEVERRRVHSICAALSDRPGFRTLSVPILQGSGPVWPWASIAKNFDALRQDHPEIVAVEEIKIETLTLDSLGLPTVTALKIDAEGGEYEVLRGARDVLAYMRPIISVELEERHREGCTYAVPAFLDALGYDCNFILNHEFVPFSRFDRDLMQRGSRSPADHVYSTPYIGCFYFIPKEASELYDRLNIESRM